MGMAKWCLTVNTYARVRNHHRCWPRGWFWLVSFSHGSASLMKWCSLCWKGGAVAAVGFS